jgi:dolichol-phosphate mannosyltransferase
MDEIKHAQNIANGYGIKLSVVFSFRNEQEVLPELIRRLRQTLNQEKLEGVLSAYELIFVNDASTDQSEAILLEHAKNHHDIRIITTSRKFGVANCVMAGLYHSQGDAIIYMDADLQDPPEVIPELLRAWRVDNSIDVVHTVRRSREGETKAKLFFTRLGYEILKKCSSIDIPIEAGDFKLLSRRAVNHLLQFKEARPFMRGLTSWIGFQQKFIEYDRAERYAGRSKFHFLSAEVIDNFLGSALISFSALPLKIASHFGLFAIFIDFILLAYVLIQMFQGQTIPGWAAIMIAVLFIGGIQLFCIGIIGLYLNAVYEQTKQRPNYIIDRTFGFSQETGIFNRTNEKPSSSSKSGS